MTRHTVTTHDERRMIEMAHDGHSLADIADAIGCSKSAVWARAKGINPRRAMNANPAKGRRMIRAAAAVPPGERQDLPSRFGYSSLNSFNAQLCRYRKRLGDASFVPARRRLSEACGQSES